VAERLAVWVLAELGPDIVFEPAPGHGRVWRHQAGLPVQSFEAGERVGPSGEGPDADAAGVLDQERCAAASSGVDDAERWQVAFGATDEMAEVSHRLRSRRRSRAPRRGYRRPFSLQHRAPPNGGKCPIQPHSKILRRREQVVLKVRSLGSTGVNARGADD